MELISFITYKIALGNFSPRHFSPYQYYYDKVQGEYDFGLEKSDNRNLIHVGANYLAGNPINSIEASINYRFDPFAGVELSHQIFFEKILNGSDRLDVTSIILNGAVVHSMVSAEWKV
ncbi:MAG: hypothetical protein KC469_05280 [Flavobacteriaceae bacterium]|nr:hypothetical protein [Flavobacteriaceae bacterium]